MSFGLQLLISCHCNPLPRAGKTHLSQPPTDVYMAGYPRPTETTPSCQTAPGPGADMLGRNKQPSDCPALGLGSATLLPWLSPIRISRINSAKGAFRDSCRPPWMDSLHLQGPNLKPSMHLQLHTHTCSLAHTCGPHTESQTPVAWHAPAAPYAPVVSTHALSV